MKTGLAADVLERWKGGEGRGRGVRMGKAGRLSVAQYVYEINGELLA